MLARNGTDGLPLPRKRRSWWAFKRTALFTVGLAAGVMSADADPDTGWRNLELPPPVYIDPTTTTVEPRCVNVAWVHVCKP